MNTFYRSDVPIDTFVPIDNNAVLDTEKPMKRANFTLSVLTMIEKKNEMKNPFQLMETSSENTSGEVHYVKHLKSELICMN